MRAVFRNIQTTLLQELDAAKETIEIAVAWFTNAVLMECLLNKLSQGVSVSLILNNDEINNNDSNRVYIERFIAGGGKIHWINYPDLMHQKFCVIDSRVVSNGSYNWTYYAENNNRENVVILDEPAIAASFHEEFVNMQSLYPQCGDIPPVGKSSIVLDDIKRYKDSDSRLGAIYYKDLPVYSLCTEWTDESIIKANVISLSDECPVIKWAHDDFERILKPRRVDDSCVFEYDGAKDPAYFSKVERRYFKLFACDNIDRFEVFNGDNDILEYNKTVRVPQDVAVLLYSSYDIGTVCNNHLAYRYNKHSIPVKISIISEEAQELRFSIETMLGIKEPFSFSRKRDGVDILYKSVPDGLFYYMVLRPTEDADCKIMVDSGSEKVEYNITVEKGIVYYIGYICNLSNRYGVNTIYIHKGVKKR